MHRRPEAIEGLRGEDPSRVYLCSPVIAEVFFGLERLPGGSRRRTLLESEFTRLRSAVRYVEWNEAAAMTFGRWKARLQKRGNPIEDMDLAIASIALELGARLATSNTRHFERFNNIELVNWTS